MSYMDLYNEWLENDIVAESDKAELRAITDEKEIEDRFYKELDFGTGGLRGVLGMGTNRMNVYTVGKATQGLANYINKKNGAEKGSCNCIRFKKNVSLNSHQRLLTASMQMALRHTFSHVSHLHLNYHLPLEN